MVDPEKNGKQLWHNLADAARALLNRPAEMRGPFANDEEALRRVAALPPRVSSSRSPEPSQAEAPAPDVRVSLDSIARAVSKHGNPEDNKGDGFAWWWHPRFDHPGNSFEHECREEDRQRARDVLSALSPAPSQEAGGASFQSRVQPWMMACFGPGISADKLERNDRFIEEALELVQASDYPKDRALALVDYVYGRDQGEINQEVGGVMVTLAAHCLAHGIDMHSAAETELARIWTKVDKIRAKQAAKPTGSALPIALPPASAPTEVGGEAEVEREITLNVKAKLRLAFRRALSELPEIAPPEVASVLSSVHMQDEFLIEGKRLQREHGTEAVAPRVEQECGAGAWSFMRKGVMAAIAHPPASAPTEAMVEAQISAAVESAEIEWSYREDDHRYPRDFWHARISFAGLSTSWCAYGEQEVRDLPTATKEEAEAELRAELRTALTATLTAGRQA